MGSAKSGGDSAVTRRRSADPKPAVGRRKRESAVVQEFARRLRILMDAANLTPESFAEKIGVSGDAARKWLRGDDVPDITRWPRIAGALKLTDTSDLFPMFPVE